MSAVLHERLNEARAKVVALEERNAALLNHMRYLVSQARHFGMPEANNHAWQQADALVQACDAEQA